MGLNPARDYLLRRGEAVPSAPSGNSLADAASGQDPLVPARGGHDYVNLVAVIHDHEGRGHRRPSIGEVDGERAGAIGIYGVSTSGRRVAEVGNDQAVDRDGIRLSKAALSVEVGHSYADLRSDRPGTAQLLSSDSESVGASDQSVGAGGKTLLGQR